MITPFAITYTINVIVFVVIIPIVLRRRDRRFKMSNTGRKKERGKKAFRVLGLALMFGIGWAFGILGSEDNNALSILFQFLFIIIVGCQGLFIFFLHTYRSKEAREQWNKWFLYATCHAHLHEERSRASVYGQHSSSNPSVRNRQTRSTLVSAATGSLIYHRQASMDEISIASSTGSSSYRPGRSVSAMRTDSPMSAGSVTPTHLQAPPMLETVEEEMEEVSPFHSLVPSSHSSGGSFHIFGNNHADDIDSDDVYFLSQ